MVLFSNRRGRCSGAYRLNSTYEEYAVHDTDNFPIEIGEYISIEELNEMYDMICELPDYITDALDEFVSHYGSLEEVYEHKDDIYFYPDCDDMTDIAYYFIDELQMLGEIPPQLQNYIDYEAYGRDLSFEGTFIETSRGYARYHIRAGRSATGKVATDSFLYFTGTARSGLSLNH